LNLAGTRLVDANVMEKLHALQGEFTRAGLRLDIVGLEGHKPLSPHPLSARRRPL
jgi:hypothetical protein